MTDERDETKHTRTKPIYPLKARKGRVFEAEQRVRECSMDEAVTGGLILNENCAILQHPKTLKRFLHRKRNLHAGDASISDPRGSAKDISTTCGAGNRLFQELEPHLRDISVVLVQLLLACTPRQSTTNNGKVNVTATNMPPSPSRNLLVDARQDYTLECAQPVAFTSGEAICPPILRPKSKVVGEEEQGGREQGAEANLLLMAHKLVVSRAASQIMLSLLKLSEVATCSIENLLPSTLSTHKLSLPGSHGSMLIFLCC